MSQWPIVTLGDVTEARPGTRNPSSRPDVPFFYVDISSVDNKQKAIVEPKQLIGADAPSRARKIIKEHDVIVSTTRPNLNAVALVGEGLADQICSTGFCVLRAKREVLTEYLFFFVTSSRFVESLSRGVGGALYPAVTDGQVRDIRIPLPPLDEQRRIVDILKRADSIRRLRKQALETTRELIPALFVDMFGDPATNPKGWEVRPLGAVVTGFEGGKNLQAGEDSTANPFRILKISAVTSGYFRPDEAKPAPDGYAPPVNHFVRKGDLLFSRANTVELVGATALVEEDYANLLLPDKLWRFVWQEPSPVAPAYIQHFLQSRHVRQELGRLATGTSDSMRNISQAKLMTLLVPIPPMDLQRAFSSHLDSVLAMSKQQGAHCKTSESFLQALMAQYFG